MTWVVSFSILWPFVTVQCSAQANVIGFPGGHFSFGAGRNFDRFKLRDQPMILSAELR